MNCCSRPVAVNNYLAINKAQIIKAPASLNFPGTRFFVDVYKCRTVIDINLTGPFLLMREVLPLMIKAGGGSIINIASLGGTRCLPACPAYCTSKAGLIMLTQQAALDYGPYNVRVNAVCPGGIDSDLLDEIILPLARKLGTDKQGGLDYFSQDVPLRRVSRPQEITGICSYLASDDSTFMTGAALLIDGGSAVVDVSGARVREIGI